MNNKNNHMLSTVTRFCVCAGIIAIAASLIILSTGSPNISSNQSYFGNEIANIKKQLTGLKEENTWLRNEITMLTAQNGVLERIIIRLRTLDAQDQKILAQLDPSILQTVTGTSPSNNSAAETHISPAQHHIVTKKDSPPSTKKNSDKSAN